MDTEIWDFKRDNSLSTRIVNRNKLFERYPGRNYLVIQYSNELKSRLAPGIKLKHGYIIDPNAKVSKLLLSIREDIKLDESTALFLFFGQKNVLAKPSEYVGYLNNSYVDKEDGYLYVMVTIENSFGRG